MKTWKKLLISSLVSASLIFVTALILAYPIVLKFLVGFVAFGLVTLLVYTALYGQ